mmetsp:Transcript_37291/g.107443  ORF Transcript_37291/g.107443 Transcript_37291/m.107443 type:complete len:218 (-) Transcript_37291:870-1523(-)
MRGRGISTWLKTIGTDLTLSMLSGKQGRCNMVPKSQGLVTSWTSVRMLWSGSWLGQTASLSARANPRRKREHPNLSCRRGTPFAPDRPMPFFARIRPPSFVVLRRQLVIQRWATSRGVPGRRGWPDGAQTCSCNCARPGKSSLGRSDCTTRPSLHRTASASRRSLKLGAGSTRTTGSGSRQGRDCHAHAFRRSSRSTWPKQTPQKLGWTTSSSVLRS